MAGNYFFLVTLIAATPNYGYREIKAGKQVVTHNYHLRELFCQQYHTRNLVKWLWLVPEAHYLSISNAT